MVQDETTQTTSAKEVNVTRHMAKRTAKNSVFLDLFKEKKYLLAISILNRMGKIYTGAGKSKCQSLNFM